MPSHLQPARLTDDRPYPDERFRLVAPPAGLEPQVTADEAVRLFGRRAEHARTGSVGVAPIWWTHERLRAVCPRRSSPATYQSAVPGGVPR